MAEPVHGPIRDLLADGLDRLGYRPATGQLDRLARHAEEIELWNPKLKLVAATGRELVIRHTLDSLAGIDTIVQSLGRTTDAASYRVADLGSGAGFPGIPIAIMYPELRIDLVERSGRRAGFLRNAVAAARISNASVCEIGLEAYRGPVPLAVYRALQPLTRHLVAALRTISGGDGVVCAYKGRREIVQAELEQLHRDGVELQSMIVPVEVPFLNEERHLLLFGAGLQTVSSTLQVRSV